MFPVIEDLNRIAEKEDRSSRRIRRRVRQRIVQTFALLNVDPELLFAYKELLPCFRRTDEGAMLGSILED